MAGLVRVTILTLFSRGVLALVFGVAGIAKLADRSGTKRTFEAFGFPTHLATYLTPVLPIVELTIALALLPAATARAGAASALVMLGAFSVAAAVAFARGRRVDCHCFGQLTSGTVGWQTLTRNGVLASLAAGVLIAGRGRQAPGFVALVDGLEGAELLAWAIGAASAALLGLGAWGFFHLLQGYGRLLLRVDALERRIAVAGVARNSGAVEDDSASVASVGLTLGTPVPALRRDTLDEGPRVLADLIRANTLVIFWNPGCGYCQSMRNDLQRWERRRSNTAPRLVIISAGDEASVRAEGFESPVLLDPDFSLGRAFGIGGTPMAVLVDAEARVASSVAAGSKAVLALAGSGA